MRITESPKTQADKIASLETRMSTVEGQVETYWDRLLETQADLMRRSEAQQALIDRHQEQIDKTTEILNNTVTAAAILRQKVEDMDGRQNRIQEFQSKIESMFVTGTQFETYVQAQSSASDKLWKVVFFVLGILIPILGLWVAHSMGSAAPGP